MMVLGVERQDGHDLACAQGDTDINHPDESVGKRCLAQGEALQHPSRLDAYERKSRHPVDNRLRAWRFLDPQSQSEETEDTRGSAKPDAGH